MAGSALEAIVLFLDADGIRHLAPLGGMTLRPEWGGDLDPHEVVVDAVAGMGLVPIMVHSTSWRVAEDAIVLTFIVAVEPPGRIPKGYTTGLVTRSELARGRATAPPPSVHLDQVVEHGLRHLAWLVHEDDAIREALAAWSGVLNGYAPEPFRAFGRKPGV